MENLPLKIIEARNIWAIKLKNTDHLQWSDLNDYQKLTFNWDDVKIGNVTKREDITIAVSQRNPEYSAERVKNISTSIKNFSSIMKGDAILGVVGATSVNKIGIVTRKDPFTFIYNMGVTIEWIGEFKPIIGFKPIFKEAVDIEKVSKKTLDYLRLPIKFSREKYSGFDGSSFEKSMNVSSRQNYEVYEKLIINDDFKDDSGGKLNLFYGTNRNRTGSHECNDYFGDDLGELKLGLCQVAIPRGHIQGEIERPTKILWAIELPEKMETHLMLTKINELSEIDFIHQLSEGISSSDEKSALIFIHGYNNTFADAARRTAQIAWDVPFNGIAGFFSWPSAGKTKDYFKDIEMADATIPQLEYFIEKIVFETQVEKLHLIAHSMGNRLLTVTLNQLSNKETFKTKLEIFHQIVLAAPDIDQNVFKNNILPQLKNIGNRRTLYASDKDKALHISEIIRNGLSRLGDAGDSIFVDDGIDTIDASNVPSSGNNHSYIFDTKELLTDLFYLLNQGLEPINRRLRERTKEAFKYWLFPK